MALKLYLHPLSSYCHKALTALYENDTAFQPVLVDATTIGEFRKLWPLGKFPVLHDEARGELVPESTIIIEYLSLHYPGKVALIPSDPERARQVRMRDRFFDLYLHTPMQKFAGDRLRPADKRDPYGVDEARRAYIAALDMAESDLAGKTWAVGGEFTMADCAAGPALFYGNLFFGPLHQTHPVSMAYLDRLMQRPSYARALREAEPFMHLLPK
ncbi:MAG TPA: glutathione S-transferase family protein [Steroidobacteraceae bacterium]|nr:glutathione S-transferase family protein [Steroidobacteraceae bacterium]